MLDLFLSTICGHNLPRVYRDIQLSHHRFGGLLLLLTRAILARLSIIPMQEFAPKNSLYKGDESGKLSDSRLLNFWLKVNMRGSGECWIWEGYTNSDGYGQLSVEGKTTGAHRIAVRAVGHDPTDKVVRHTCHNPSCVNPQHLELGTQRKNVQDMVDAGRQARGERNGNSKLSADQVRAIRASDRSPKELARKYPTSVRNVRAIRARKTWDHLE